MSWMLDDSGRKVLAEAGMPAIEAILSATRNASDLLGAADHVGSIQKGRYADMVATSGDPLQNIDELRRITFVMKGGVVHKGVAAAPRTGTRQ